MRVLVACEFSGAVREAFRARGHDAWSCDLLDDEGGSPYHFVADVLGGVLRDGWDLMIAHPPCTHLAVSGARHFLAKIADGRQQEAIDFFMALANAPIPRIAIENPVCIMSSVWREPDQIVQPWMWGEYETKATCLWLKGLPRLVPNYHTAEECREAAGIPPGVKPYPRVHLMPPGPNRWKDRSRTYVEIADAMADQWGNYTDLVTQAEAA